MVFTFSILLIFQCLGEGLVFALGLPIPGPVAGMLLLLAALTAFPALLDKLEDTGNELLRHLSLLFVPAGVGIMSAASSIGAHWLALVLSVIGSTLIAMAVTALVMRAAMARTADKEPPP